MFLNSLMAFAIHTLEPVAKWSAIVILTSLFLVGSYLYLTKRKILPKFLKYSTLALAVYFLFLAVCLFVADLTYHYSDEYAQENWLDKSILISHILLPLCAFIGSILLACLVHGYAKYKKYAKLKQLKNTLFIGVSCVFILTLLQIGRYYLQKIDGDGYFNSDSASVKQFALYACSVILTFLLLTASRADKQPLDFQAKPLAHAGICVSMSFALSYVKLWDMPNGGALTLASLFPLALYSYVYGTKKGLFAGFCYSLLQAVQDPWIIHPAQFLLDYPIAFTSVGLAGLFKESKLNRSNPRLAFSLGCGFVGIFRYTAHVLSGIFAFEAYAKGQNAVLFSLAYNVYVLVDIALVIAAAIAVSSSKTFTKEL
ncbi:MAG: energy-coupled thiamine transporter ThiT [Clostridia bacterium]|nr:energy-coupled thiamine transporter ThiT [Clostridia bacterium]